MHAGPEAEPGVALPRQQDALEPVLGSREAAGDDPVHLRVGEQPEPLGGDRTSSVAMQVAVVAAHPREPPGLPGADPGLGELVGEVRAPARRAAPARVRGRSPASRAAPYARIESSIVWWCGSTSVSTTTTLLPTRPSSNPATWVASMPSPLHTCSRRLELETAGEHRQPCPEPLLVGRAQVVAPGHRRLERTQPVGYVAEPRSEQAVPVAQAGEHRLRRELTRSARRRARARAAARRAPRTAARPRSTLSGVSWKSGATDAARSTNRRTASDRPARLRCRGPPGRWGGPAERGGPPARRRLPRVSRLVTRTRSSGQCSRRSSTRRRTPGSTRSLLSRTSRAGRPDRNSTRVAPSPVPGPACSPRRCPTSSSTSRRAAAAARRVARLGRRHVRQVDQPRVTPRPGPGAERPGVTSRHRPAR